MEQENQPEIIPEIKPDNTIKFDSIKGMLSCPYYHPRKIEYLRERRNELLKATDYYLVTDIHENKLNAIKIHRQELRDFINKLVNDEIECNLIDDEFADKYFSKFILDGTAEA